MTEQIDGSEFEITGEHPEGQPHFEMKPCLRFLFYVQGDREEVRPGMTHFYDLSLQLIEAESRFHFKPFKARYGSDGYVQHAKNTKATWRYLDDYFAGKVKGPEFGLTLETTENPYGISDKAFDVHHAENGRWGHVSLTLPVDHFGDDWPSCVAFAHDLARDLPFKSGYVGYAVNVAFEYGGIRREAGTPVFHLSRKYLGVDFRLPYEFSDFEDPNDEWSSYPGKITNLGWITYLDRRFTQKVRGGLDDAIVVHELPQGKGYQVGPRPSILRAGDTEAIRPYRALARSLRELGLRRDMVGRSDLIGGEENTRWWMERFGGREAPACG